MENPLSQLCYVSTAVRLMSRDSLTEILQTARRNNAQRNITGLLLYKDMSFLQIVEGKAADVHELYEAIRSDPRHHRVSLMFETEIEQREFGEWAMGFYQPEAEEFEYLPNYSDFMQSGLIHRSLFEDQSRARGILNHFRKLS